MSVLGSVAGSMKIPLGHIVGDLAERSPVKASPARTPLLNPAAASTQPNLAIITRTDMSQQPLSSHGSDTGLPGLICYRPDSTYNSAREGRRGTLGSWSAAPLSRSTVGIFLEHGLNHGPSAWFLAQGFPRAPFVCSSGLPDLICYRTDSAFADARGRAGRVPWRLDTEPRRLPIGRKATFLGRRLNQQRSAWFPCLTTVGCDSCRSPWESVWPVDIRPAS